MPAKPKETKKQKKERRWNALQDACIKYSKCLFVEVDNVTSKQISVMRKELREIDAKMIMGKNVSDTTFSFNSLPLSMIDPHEGCDKGIDN